MEERKVQIYHIHDYKTPRLTNEIFEDIKFLINIEVFNLNMKDLWALKDKKVHLILFDAIAPEKLLYEAIEPIQENNKNLYTAIVYKNLSEKRKTLAYDKHIDYIFEAQYDDKYIKAKLKNILRRMSAKYLLETDYTFKDVKVDRLLGEIFIKGTIVETTRKEFKLIKELIKHHQQFRPKNIIFQNIWGYEHDTSRILDQYIQRIKKVLSNADIEIVADRKKGLMII